jgi:membrane protein YdbS with pleckstrin-like domain
VAALPEPTRRLPTAAKSYWRATGAFQSLVVLVLGLSVMAALDGALMVLPVLGIVVAAALLVGVVPGLRWRRWAYEIRDEEIDLRRGAFVVQRTLIPIRRVQHVDTESGPLQDGFGLATVTFHTAAGGVSIPALSKTDAETVRARVAQLARTRDDT